MVQIDDSGGGPTLNPKAKHYERELFKVFSVQTYSIASTQTDWQDAKSQLEALARDVRSVRGELEAPSDGSRGWTGPAAQAALATLGKLSDTLDVHAGEVGDVDTSLGQVYQAVSDAKSAYYAEVSSISTYVDPDDHKRLPAPYLPTAENTENYSVRDPEAAAAAEDALWEQRNQAAKRVLDQLSTDTQTAKATMPIDVKDDTETPYDNQGPASTNRTPGSATQSPTAGSYIEGGTEVITGIKGPNGGDDDDPPVILNPTPEEPEIITCGPEVIGPDPVDPGLFDPISSDGDVTGSTGVSNPTGPGGSPGSYPSGSGGSGMGAGGLAAGGMGGAAGLGGLLRRGGLSGGASGAARGGAAGAARGGASGAARGGAPGGARGGVVGGGGGGARGSAPRPGGAGGAGRGGSVVPGGAGGARGGAAGRTSAVKGATGSGRYGVPKLGGGKGGAGVVPAGGGQAGRGTGAGKGQPRPAGKAGGRAVMGATAGGGTRKGPKDAESQDVDKLTHEDEETWFEGTEESSPQVWQ